MQNTLCPKIQKLFRNFLNFIKIDISNFLKPVSICGAIEGIFVFLLFLKIVRYSLLRNSKIVLE